MATSNIYIVPAFPPLDNVSTTLLGRRAGQHTDIAIQLPAGRVERGSSHQGKFPRASQDHSIACYAEKLELAAQLLLLANAHHAALVPLIAQLL